jgi:hypothetical protein
MFRKPLPWNLHEPDPRERVSSTKEKNMVFMRVALYSILELNDT